MGQVISWVIALSRFLLTYKPAAAGVALADHTIAIWRTQVRFIGAGTIAVAAVYTLVRLTKLVMGGLGGAHSSLLAPWPRRTTVTAISRPRGSTR